MSIMAICGISPTALTGIDGHLSPISPCCSRTTDLKQTEFRVGGGFLPSTRTKNGRNVLRIERRQKMGVKAVIGSAALLAKEMERVAAKEALLLTIKDAGGLRGLPSQAANDKAGIEVNEKILVLERLNPTPRPSTSPNFEGLWRFEWAAARSPGIVFAKTLFTRFPTELAALDSLTLEFSDDGLARANGILKVLSTVESSFTLVTKITVEGPVKLREEYVEALFATPRVSKSSVPSQLKGFVDQLVAAAQRLPGPVRDAVNAGVKFPLSGTFSRDLLISYLDEEVLIARDKTGAADVLLKLEAPAIDINTDDVIAPEYMR